MQLSTTSQRSNEFYEMVEHLASVHIPINKIMIILEISSDEFWHCFTHDQRFRTALNKGSLEMQTDLNAAIFTLAKNNHFQAIELAKEIIAQTSRENEELFKNEYEDYLRRKQYYEA